MLDIPCGGCTDRIIGCHSNCERYSAYRTQIDKRNTAKYEFNEIEKSFIARTTGYLTQKWKGDSRRRLKRHGCASNN